MRPRALALFCFCLISCFALSTATYAQPTAPLTVEVSGLRNYKGSVILYLWADTQETAKFPDVSRVQGRDECSDAEPCDVPKRAVCRRTIDSLYNLTVSYTFRNLALGDYAVFVVHDENNNGIADTGLLRRPLEARGYSQVLPDEINPIAQKFSFQRTRFTLTEAKTMTIGLRYPPRF